MEKKLLLFGAGKIGRSFIGQLFSRSGFEVVFIDLDNRIIEALNQSHSYNVIIKSTGGDEIIHVNNVRGIHAKDIQGIIDEISTASILALSVGQHGLPHVIPVLAKGLIERQEKYPEEPLDIIIAENMRNADQYVKKELRKYLPVSFPIDRLTGLVETSIGKMVPIMTKKDMDDDVLQVFAEPYNTLILDKKAFLNPIPEVEGLAPKGNMKAWVDRKLFIHNLGHATTAYAGFYHYPDRKYLHEVLKENEIHAYVYQTMKESADILRSLYPNEFSSDQLDNHITDLISRFQNKALGDTIFRVGCDLKRKLGPDDRILSPLKSGIQNGLPVENITLALVYATFFEATDESGQIYPVDKSFMREKNKGLDHLLKKFCGLNIQEHRIVFQQVEAMHKNLIVKRKYD